MPTHQLELALWLEADRMGSLLAALDDESMENQRDVVKNERRQRYDNVPYGTAFEKLTALAYPEGHPYHHTPIGSMADLDAATLEDARDVLPHVLRAEQRRAVRRRRHRPGADARLDREVLRHHPRARRQAAARATARCPTSSASSCARSSRRRSRRAP